jgi:hypothetical protein
MPDDIVIKQIPPDDWSWVPPAAKTLEEAYLMGANPPRQMTQEELEKIYPREA